MKRFKHEKELVSSMMTEMTRICKHYISILLRVLEAVEAGTKFLPCLVLLCWSARSHLGPPEVEIDDDTVRSPAIVENIRESLRDVKFSRSGAAIAGEECTICLSKFMESESVYMLPRCNHLFHKLCFNQWLSRNKSTCPLCRSSLEVKEQHMHLHPSETPFQESSLLQSQDLISRSRAA